MSVEFDTVKLDGRRRRLDPVTLGAIGVVVALVLAVVKPWGAGNNAGAIAVDAPASQTPQALTGLRGTAAASVALPRVIRSNPRSTSVWGEIEPIISRHEAWGVRAIVIRPRGIDTPLGSKRRLAERWLPLSLDTSETLTAQVDPSDLSILAIGVTFPPSHTPLDIRIWRATTSGLDWIDMSAVDPVPSAGAYLFVRPGDVDGPPRPWGAGTYRVDVLVDGSIRRFAIAIPDRFSNIPAPSDRPSLRDQGPLPDPADAVLPDLPIGPFATVDGVGLPLDADEGSALDETSAWLDLDPGTGRMPRSYVAAAYLPRATGLGVMLPPGSVVQSAGLERIAPEPLPVEPARVEVRAGAATDSRANVLFRAPDGGTWTAGVYRISVVWADPDGLHDRSWHVELRQGPVRSTSRLLAAARSWARFAGRTGVILGTAEPLDGGPGNAAIRLVDIRPRDASYPVPSGVGCGGTVIDRSPGILGFAYPAGQYRSVVTARILRPFLRRDDQVLMTAAFGVMGLVLAAPARIPMLPPADYEFVIGAGASALAYNLCLGMQSFDD